MIITYDSKVTPVMLYTAAGDLCCKPYPGHHLGCPNYGKKTGCPPMPRWGQVFSTAYPGFVIINRFNFADHVAKMKDLHPNMTEKQLKCCLYWQQTARKELKEGIKSFYDLWESVYFVTTCPEAYGVNIGDTVKQLGD